MGKRDDARSRALRDALGALGYPGFLTLFSEIEAEEGGHDPAVVLMAALACERLDERVVEALPWLILRYERMDWEWLFGEARRRSVQNRLGFVVGLALKAAAGGTASMERLTQLAAIEEELFACRLNKEDGQWQDLPASRRQWIKERRSREAAQWGILSDLRPQDLPV